MTIQESTPESIVAILRRETASLHKETEEAFPIMSKNITLSEYANILVTFSAMYRDIEEQIDQCPNSVIREFADQHRRLPALENDIRFISGKIKDLKHPHSIPPAPKLKDTAAWLGMLYVTEGSRLGGIFIAQHLEKQFYLSKGDGYSFFAGSGRKTREEWGTFCQLCNELGQNYLTRDIVEAAKEAFDWFLDCFRAADFVR